ncbi:ABC transporter permease [Ruminococcus sp.]|uniref:ABC transporter permease n=1 Tax=Ruminococcus sp. TaxID=41978 RepID=UPI00388E2D62
MKYLRLFLEQSKISIMSVAAYRANFVLMIIQSVVNAVLSIISVKYIYNYVDKIADWSYGEMMILIGTSMLVNQLFRAFILPNLNQFVADIGNGNFDAILLKPVSLLFMIFFGRIDLSSLVSIIAPTAIVVIFARSATINLTIVELLMYIVLVVCSVIILSAFMLIIHSVAFFYIKVDGLMNVYYMIMAISEKPKDIIPTKILRNFFTWIFPAVPLACLPVSIILHKILYRYFLVEAVIALIMLLCAKALTYMGVKKYSSASS